MQANICLNALPVFSEESLSLLDVSKMLHSGNPFSESTSSNLSRPLWPSWEGQEWHFRQGQVVWTLPRGVSLTGTSDMAWAQTSHHPLSIPLCPSMFTKNTRQPVKHSLRPLQRKAVQFSSVQFVSCVRLFATPWAAECQASLSIAISRSDYSNSCPSSR